MCDKKKTFGKVSRNHILPNFSSSILDLTSPSLGILLTVASKAWSCGVGFFLLVNGFVSLCPSTCT